MSDQPGYRPSNGTEGSYMRDRNCWLCVADHNFHNAADSTDRDPCPILNDAFMAYPGPGPKEWVHDPETGYPGNARCVAFAGICSCARPDDVTMLTEFHHLDLAESK